MEDVDLTVVSDGAARPRRNSARRSRPPRPIVAGSAHWRARPRARLCFARTAAHENRPPGPAQAREVLDVLSRALDDVACHVQADAAAPIARRVMVAQAAAAALMELLAAGLPPP